MNPHESKCRFPKSDYPQTSKSLDHFNIGKSMVNWGRTSRRQAARALLIKVVASRRASGVVAWPWPQIGDLPWVYHQNTGENHIKKVPGI